MAGMSHARFVRAEHAAVAVGVAIVASLVPLSLLSGEVQAAGSVSAVPKDSVAGGPIEAAPQLRRVEGSSEVPGEAKSDARPEVPRRIAAVAAPREAVAPRQLVEVASEAGPKAFAEVSSAPSNSQDPAAGPTDAPPSPPVDLSHTPSGWYTPVAHYYFSARFGVAGSWSSGHHTGLDFVTKQGAAIRAATDGVVVAADWAGAYGQLLQIQIGPKMQIWMAHLDQFKVSKGDVVKAGQVVGLVGMTGNTTGPHCHFEVRVKGAAVDPEPYFWPDGNSVTRIRR